MKYLVILVISVFNFAQIPSAFSSESSVYDFEWLDSDKEIYVLQNRKFRKKGSFYVGGTGNKTLSGAFVDSYGGSVVGGYFFSEDWGIEAIYTSASGATNNTYELSKESSAIPYYRKITDYMGAMLMWSPFYSKINTFDQIFYYDWLFGIGGATVTTLNNNNSFGVSTEETLIEESSTALIWTTGLRFHISQTWSFRMDFRALHTRVTQPDGTQASGEEKQSWYHNYNLGLGLNVAF